MRPKFGKLMNISGCLHKVGVWPEPVSVQGSQEHSIQVAKEKGTVMFL